MITYRADVQRVLRAAGVAEKKIAGLSDEIVRVVEHHVDQGTACRHFNWDGDEGWCSLGVCPACGDPDCPGYDLEVGRPVENVTVQGMLL